MLVHKRLIPYSAALRKSCMQTRVCESWKNTHPPSTASPFWPNPIEPSYATASKHRSPHSVRVSVGIKVRVGWSASGAPTCFLFFFCPCMMRHVNKGYHVKHVRRSSKHSIYQPISTAVSPSRNVAYIRRQTGTYVTLIL